MKFGFFIFIILFFNQLFCSFYIETDETSYSYGQDIYITFNIHNTSADTVNIQFPNSFPFSYYIDSEHFSLYSYPMGFNVSIPPDSTYSSTCIHTDFVEIGIHDLVGVFEVYNWSTNPISIIVEEEVSIEDDELLMNNYSLSNYPNPFNPTTEISFTVPQTSSFVTIEIYNSRGQKIKTISPSLCHPAFIEGRGETKYNVVWDGTNELYKQVPSGVYLYKLVSNSKELAVNKMLLLK